MEVQNKLYQRQGIHLISSLFTVDKGVVKVLLIKRKNEPYREQWALVGGALYNNEDLEDGLVREIKEKTGIENIDLSLSNVFGKVDRSPVMRMVAISYIGVIDCKRVSFLKDTLKTSNADWFPIDRIPEPLAYDHSEILNEALEKLKVKITNSTILKSLFPEGFTLPELQKAYESILGYPLDRRNFRRKMLSSGLIYDTGREVKFEGTKPAKWYRFIDEIENKSVF